MEEMNKNLIMEREKRRKEEYREMDEVVRTRHRHWSFADFQGIRAFPAAAVAIHDVGRCSLPRPRSSCWFSETLTLSSSYVNG
jgi:hypothetical protein